MASEQLERPPAVTAPAQRGEQVVRIQGVPWSVYAALSASRGESSAVRMAYHHGELEIMAPGEEHELAKKTLARLIEAYAETLEIDLDGRGSWTLTRDGEASLEADECYIVGSEPTKGQRPDFAVEVSITSGGVAKLKKYVPLQIPEVWVYKDGQLAFYALTLDQYVRVERSRFLPGLDAALVERCMAEPTQSRAIRALRAAL